MNPEDAAKIIRVLAQLKARKEILLKGEELNYSMPTEQTSLYHKSKLEQVSLEHVRSALKKWNVK